MKKIYKQPMIIMVTIGTTNLMDNSIPVESQSASTKDGNYDKALSRRGSFWEDEEE